MDIYVLEYMVRTLIAKIWILPVLIGLCFLSSAILVSAEETDFADNDVWEEELYIEPLEVIEDPLAECSVDEHAQETSSEEPAQETSAEVTEEPAQETSAEVTNTDQETSAEESTQSPNTSIDGDQYVDVITLHNDNILLTASLFVLSGFLVALGFIKIML